MSFSRSTLLTIVTVGIIIVGFIFLLVINSSQKVPVSFAPQKSQLFVVGRENNQLVNVVATTLPEFGISLADEKFKNIWQASPAQRSQFVQSTITNAKGDVNLSVTPSFNDAKRQLILTPQMQNKVKPGLYTLHATIKTVQGEYITITQDFRWGVLAINTTKGSYQLGEDVSIGMAVLDDLGETKCISQNNQLLFNTATVTLTITSPSGKAQEFSTTDQTITGSKDCKDRSFTYKPDFSALFHPGEVGAYSMRMQAETLSGTEVITDSFVVKSTQEPFVIERIQYPTRIYPRLAYPMQIKITANQNYSGPVIDVVPSTFTISSISGAGQIQQQGEFQEVIWQVNWQKGMDYTLSYTVKFPPITPEFYLVGPLHIGSYTEGREWQVASDSIFSEVQESHNSGTGVTTISTTPSTPTGGDLLILICERPDSSSFRSPTGGGSGGWTAITNTGSGTPRIYWYYKIAPASGWTNPNCRTNTSGNLSIQMIEFSGNSISGVADVHATMLTNSNSCNSGGNQIVTNSATEGNPDELVVGVFGAAAGNLTYTNNTTIGSAGSSGFTDVLSGGFNTTTGSYYSSWGESLNNTAVAQTETVTLSGGGTRCAGDIAFFNPTITVSQGGFQFFNNINSVDPTTTFVGTSQNQNITLSQPNQAFRLRMLLDVDSPTTSLASSSGDFILVYATMSAGLTCATASYDPVSTPLSGSAISFNANPFTPTSGWWIHDTLHIPTDTGAGGYTTRPQSYYQDDTNGPGPTGGGSPGDITNDQSSLTDAQAGMWDFSLIDNTDDSVSTTYCIRIVNGSGVSLNAYRQNPEVTTLNNDVVIRGSPNGTYIKGSPGTNGTEIH